MSISLSETAGTQTVRDRRLIIRVVDYWEALLGRHQYPRMADFDIDALPDVAPQSFLIDINPKNVQVSQLRYVGASLAQDCGDGLVGKPVTSVPRGSLLSRLTDHFLQILANRAPMSFEAEYNEAGGKLTKYRGIMLPLSRTGEDIDFILGVINGRSDDTRLRAVPSFETAAVPAGVVQFPEEGRTSAPVSAVCDMMEELQECRGAAYMLQDAQERLVRREFAVLENAYRLLHSAREKPLAFAALLEECRQTLGDQDLVAAILRLVLGNSYSCEDRALYAAVLRRALADRQTPETLPAYLEGLEGGLRGLMHGEPIPFNLGGLLRPR